MAWIGDYLREMNAFGFLIGSSRGLDSHVGTNNKETTGAKLYAQLCADVDVDGGRVSSAMKHFGIALNCTVPSTCFQALSSKWPQHL